MDTAIASSTLPDLSTDPVSTLRAAALSTLKAKRRKPPPATPARPPPPPDTLHLDYGAEDSPEDLFMKDTPAPVPPIEQSPNFLNQQPREEGEISDEDEPPPTNSSVNTPLATLAKTITPEPLQGSETARPLQIPLPEENTPGAISSVQSDSSRGPLSAVPQPPPDTPMEGIILTEHPLVFSPLGLDYIRPGLQMTQHQYDTVKDIVLDLLGWGVPPAYLIDCGVSREAVFYVFSELNLALPESLDVSGLKPHFPEYLPHSQPPTVVPPLSDKDIARSGTHPTNHPVVPQSAKSFTAPDAPLPLDLHDIERQRRQELLARKAAQASRKIRQSDSLGSSDGSSTAKDILTVVPASSTEAVDNFLNSLGPAVDLPADNRTKSISSDDMDVQDVPTSHHPEPHVRRLSSSSGSRSTPSQDTTLTVDSTAPISDASILDKNSNPGFIATRPAPLSSSSSTFSQITTSDVVPSTPRSEHANLRSRRGVKRAVATDFDFDGPPRRTGSAYPPTRPPSTAFVTIASRRCVIDLSDSEAEDDLSHSVLHASQDQLVSKNEWKGKPSTSSSPSAKPSTPSGTAPSALLQKELEIQQMRELIARREEETRLKKLAAKVSNDVDPNLIQPQPVWMKVEETDVIMSSGSPLMDAVEIELVTRRSSESASPPGEISEASLPITRSVTKSPIVKSSIQHPCDQDLASTPRETQVFDSSIKPFLFSMVDADMFPPSSAQMNKSPTITSSLLKQDGKNLSVSDPSAEIPNLQPIVYTDYVSPFDHYPLLRSQSSTSGFSLSPLMHASFVASNFHSSPTLAASLSFIGSSLVPDLKPLRLAVLSKQLDPSKRLCHYESGGGTCRDDKCEDLHLSKLEGMFALGLLEPTDEETADFLFSVLPRSWLSTFQVHSPDKILEALQHVQQQAPNDLTDKVAHAISLIGSSPPPTNS